MRKQRKKNRIVASVVCMMALIVSFLVNSKDVLATRADYGEKNFLQVSGYEVTNETIVLGKEFTLKVNITNYSKRTVANNVIVAISNPEGVVPAYGTVTIKQIETIAPGETKIIDFGYVASSQIKNSEVNFKVNLSSNETSSEAQIRIQVGKKTEFNIKQYYLPKEFTLGKSEVVSAYLENIGMTTVNNVVMKIRLNGIDVAETNIGTMSAGTTKTEYANVCLLQSGQYTLEMVLTYITADGTEKEHFITSSSVNVSEPELEEESTTESSSKIQQTVVPEESKNIVVIYLAGIVLIGICCVILLIAYRRK